MPIAYMYLYVKHTLFWYVPSPKIKKKHSFLRRLPYDDDAVHAYFEFVLSKSQKYAWLHARCLDSSPESFHNTGLLKNRPFMVDNSRHVLRGLKASSFEPGTTHLHDNPPSYYDTSTEASSIVTSSSSGSGGFCTLCLFCICRRQLSLRGNDLPPPCFAYAHPLTVQ